MTNLPLPDQLAEQLQAAAKAEGVAVQELLRQMLNERSAMKRSEKLLTTNQITARFDAVYAHQPSSLYPLLQQLQSRSLEREDW